MYIYVYVCVCVICKQIICWQLFLNELLEFICLHTVKWDLDRDYHPGQSGPKSNGNEEVLYIP